MFPRYSCSYTICSFIDNGLFSKPLIISLTSLSLSTLLYCLGVSFSAHFLTSSSLMFSDAILSFFNVLFLHFPNKLYISIIDSKYLFLPNSEKKFSVVRICNCLSSTEVFEIISESKSTKLS